MKHVRRLISVVVGAALLIPAPTSALPKGAKASRYASGFNAAIDAAWVPGTKTIFVTEKNGKIRIVKGGRLLSKPCTTIDVNQNGERGLLGIALDSKFKRNKRLYVYYTNAQPLDNRVARYVVKKNRCTNRKVILKDLDASSSGYHNGGQIEFVKGKLFVAVGDAHSPAMAQNTAIPEGKILRINPDGSAPSSNPFGNKVWSYGHRNPFGLTHKPGTSKIYSSENGPQCDDEMNHIRKGRNYGWGSGYECGTAGVGPNATGPIRRWSSIIVPTDPVWYNGRAKSLNNDLYVGAYGGGELHRLVMNAKGTAVKKDRVIHRADAGIVDVSKGPGGWLYYLTMGALYRIKT